MRPSRDGARACRSALAGGVGLLFNPEPTAMFQRAGMLSPAGRCQTLDADADGYVRAEACCALALVAPEEASSAGRGAGAGTAVALLAGSAVNQDGRSSALTAPNGPAQQEVVRAALASACLAPADLHTLQMHGTGTPLGDPIEVGAAAAVLGSTTVSGREQQQQQQQQGVVFVQAIKTSAGHTEAAAGVLGLAHAAHAQGQLHTHAMLHLRNVSPHLAPLLGGSAADAAAGGVAWSLPRQPAAMAPPGAAAASAGVGGQRPAAAAATGVSGFAFQGTNVHALLVPGARAPSAPAPPVAGRSGAVWRRQAYWPVAPATPLLTRVLVAPQPPSQACVHLETELDHPGLCALRGIRVPGAPGPLLPPSVPLTCAALAGRALLHASDGGAGASAPTCAAVARASLPSPAVLPAPGAGGVLRCVLRAADGLVQVLTAAVAAPAGQAERLHLSAHLVLAPAAATAARGAAASAVPQPSAATRLAAMLQRPSTALPHTRPLALLAAHGVAGPQRCGEEDVGRVAGMEAGLTAAGCVSFSSPPPVSSGSAPDPQLKVLTALVAFTLPPPSSPAHGLAYGYISASCGAHAPAAAALGGSGRLLGVVFGALPGYAASALGAEGQLRLPAHDGGLGPSGTATTAPGSGPAHALLALPEQERGPFLQVRGCALCVLSFSWAACHPAVCLDRPAVGARWRAGARSGRGARAHRPRGGPARAAHRSRCGAAPLPSSCPGAAVRGLPPRLAADQWCAWCALLGCTAGVDSLGAMELRHALSESVGVPLPPTLLYDHQTAEEIATFVVRRLERDAAAAPAPSSAADNAVAREWAPTTSAAAGRGGGSGGDEDDDAHPSSLLKLLRPPPPRRPLFLAAPGVANAQAAYFTFSSFLQWSEQPIFVLEKDNDLDIRQCVRAHAGSNERRAPLACPWPPASPAPHPPHATHAQAGHQERARHAQGAAAGQRPLPGGRPLVRRCRGAGDRHAAAELGPPRRPPPGARLGAALHCASLAWQSVLSRHTLLTCGLAEATWRPVHAGDGHASA